ncbi:MAG: F0F1 ATP synthase subunit A, partial [Blastocatellia bacterium]
MLAAILALLQEGHGAAEASAEHSEAAGKHAAEPWLVEQVNHVLGPMVLSAERVIMPPIYGLFGANWHEPAPGELVIPEHVVWSIALMIICFAGVFWLRGRLSVDRPSKGQQLLEVAIENIRGLLDQVIGPYGRRYLPVVGSFALFILIGNLMGQIPGLG